MAESTFRVEFAYGNQQQFKLRHDDLNIIGWVGRDVDVERASWRLNEGDETILYVEPSPTDKIYPWDTRTPGVHRLRHLKGWFNVEIPISHPALLPGVNTLSVRVVDATGKTAIGTVQLDWDPVPVTLPVEITDIRAAKGIQEVGQPVNGLFEFDYDRNAIAAPAPAGPDMLFLIGSPHGDQEATYDVQFAGPLSGDFLGLSDFFVRHELQDESLGIKPGYSTNGLATLRRTGLACLWMSTGDCLTDKNWAWVAQTPHEPHFPVEADVRYSVRHQIFQLDGVAHTRLRIWRADQGEPRRWLCHLQRCAVDGDGLIGRKSSFGLFKYGGGRTEWSNIRVRYLDVNEVNQKEPVVRWVGFRSRSRRFLRAWRSLFPKLR